VAFAGEIPDSIDQGLVVAGFKVEVLNVLGAGDAFMGGFLRGWLRGEALAECCRFGNACGAMVVTRHACAPRCRLGLSCNSSCQLKIAARMPSSAIWTICTGRRRAGTSIQS